MNVPIRKYLVHMRSVKAPVTPVIQIPACTIYFEKILCHGQRTQKIPHGQVPPASSQWVGKPDYFLWDGILIALSSVCSCSTIGRPNIDMSDNHILTIGINNCKTMSNVLVFPKRGKFRICFYWIWYLIWKERGWSCFSTSA